MLCNKDYTINLWPALNMFPETEQCLGRPVRCMSTAMLLKLVCPDRKKPPTRMYYAPHSQNRIASLSGPLLDRMPTSSNALYTVHRARRARRLNRAGHLRSMA